MVSNLAMLYFSQLAALATAAPLAEPAAGSIIADKYIVTMKLGTGPADIASHLNWVTKKSQLTLNVPLVATKLQ